MTFIIRKIRRRPNGQEIVRDQPVKKTELSVGRATDCDIYLPDLRVSLNHAQIESAGNSVRVVATSDKPVKSKNKFGSRFVFASTEHAKVEIGPYLLEIYKEAGNDSIIVSTERVEEKTAALQPEDEQRIFSLNKVMPGKRSSAWFFAFLTVFAAIAAPIFYFYSDRKADVADPIEVRADQELLGTRIDQLWLSGEMSLAHTSLADNCNACHMNAFQTVTDQTCLSSGCHDGIRNHAIEDELWTSKPPLTPGEQFLRTAAGMFGKEEMRCASCHLEHNGRDGIIINEEEMCGTCHSDMTDRLRDTDLINVSFFDTDHPNFRPTVVTEPHETDPVVQRVSLDDNPMSRSGLKFPHDVHLESGGAVAKQASDYADEWGFGEVLVCEDCHQTNAAGALFLPVVMEENCGMCHNLTFETDPVTGYQRTLRHGEPEDVIASMQDFYNASAARLFDEATNGETTTRRRPGDVAEIREEGRLLDALLDADTRSQQKVIEIFSEGGSCYDCHTIVQPTGDDPTAFNIAPVSVEQSFMPKADFHHESHEFMDCQDCHEAETSANATDVILPGIDNCLDCHRGQTTVNFIPSTCLMCHDYHDDSHTVPEMTPASSRHAGFWPQRDRNVIAGEAVSDAIKLSMNETDAK